MAEGAPDFPHGEIKGERVKQRPDVVSAKLKKWLGCIEQTQHIGMAHHTALRLSRGARGVDDVGGLGGQGERQLGNIERVTPQHRHNLGFIDMQTIAMPQISVCRAANQQLHAAVVNLKLGPGSGE